MIKRPTKKEWMKDLAMPVPPELINCREIDNAPDAEPPPIMTRYALYVAENTLFSVMVVTPDPAVAWPT